MLQAVLRFLTLPRVFTALCPVPISALARRLGRRDGDQSPGRNDWAVSTAVLLMIVGAVLKAFGSGQNVSVYWFVGGLVLLLLSIDHDRRYSWVRDNNGRPTENKAILLGIVIPVLLALLIFLLYLSET